MVLVTYRHGLRASELTDLQMSPFVFTQRARRFWIYVPSGSVEVVHQHRREQMREEARQNGHDPDWVFQ
jgi:hypothetical protein